MTLSIFVSVLNKLTVLICQVIILKKMVKLSKSPKSMKENLLFYNRFIRYAEIVAYLKMLKRTYPKNVSLLIIGQSCLKRPIYMIRLGMDMKHNCKYATFIDANIHAREWISNSTVLFYIDHLIRNRSLLRIMDYYIVPCLNPDGYEYTHTHTKHRLWRKNMNCNNSKEPSLWGVDLNRNFPHGFGLEGSSNEPSSFNYRGTHALSEPEAKSLANTLRKFKNLIKLYISIHSFGNVILYPWCYTKKKIEDHEQLQRCGEAAKEAMRSFKDRHYRVGSSANTLYVASGSSMDYARGDLNIKFSFTIELERFGKSGFKAPTNKIIEIGQEVCCGIDAMVRHVKHFYTLQDSLKSVARMPRKLTKYSMKTIRK